MKSIGLTQFQYAAVVANATACGFFVGRGAGSRLAEFVALACAEYAERHAPNHPLNQTAGDSGSDPDDGGSCPHCFNGEVEAVEHCVQADLLICPQCGDELHMGYCARCKSAFEIANR